MLSSLPLTDAAFFRDATTAWPPHGGTVGSSTAQRVYCRQPNDLHPAKLMRVATVNRKTHFMAQKNRYKSGDLGRTVYCPLAPCSEQQLLKNVEK